eukprot:s94_g11.t1
MASLAGSCAPQCTCAAQYQYGGFAAQARCGAQEPAREAIGDDQAAGEATGLAFGYQLQVSSANRKELILEALEQFFRHPEIWRPERIASLYRSALFCGNFAVARADKALNAAAKQTVVKDEASFRQASRQRLKAMDFAAKQKFTDDGASLKASLKAASRHDGMCNTSGSHGVKTDSV